MKGREGEDWRDETRGKGGMRRGGDGKGRQRQGRREGGEK